jgi:hypothetical protein
MQILALHEGEFILPVLLCFPHNNNWAELSKRIPSANKPRIQMAIPGTLRWKRERDEKAASYPKGVKSDVDYPYTGFLMSKEDDIYNMAHRKLEDPERDLLSRVLLRNFIKQQHGLQNSTRKRRKNTSGAGGGSSLAQVLSIKRHRNRRWYRPFHLFKLREETSGPGKILSLSHKGTLKYW